VSHITVLGVRTVTAKSSQNKKNHKKTYLFLLGMLILKKFFAGFKNILSTRLKSRCHGSAIVTASFLPP